MSEKAFAIIMRYEGLFAAAAAILSVHVDVGWTTGTASSSRVVCTTLCL